MLRNNTDAHISSLGYLCVSIKISISLGKTFLRISRIRNIPLTWILARVFVCLPPFISQILDFIYWTVLILILIYCEWRDTENHGLERKSAGSFPEQRPFVIPIDSRQGSWQGGVMNSSIAPIGIARRMILAIVTSREIYPGNFKWIQPQGPEEMCLSVEHQNPSK